MNDKELLARAYYELKVQQADGSIDDTTKLEGLLTEMSKAINDALPGPYVCLCGSRDKLLRNDKYDAYYCPDCRTWFEPQCSDLDCHYCSGRPEKAPDIT